MIKKITKYIPTEDQECQFLVEYLNILQHQGKVIKFCHINNEVYTKSWSQKRRIQSMGTPAGFPDYCIVIKDKFNSYILLFIEMKRIKGSVQSTHQKEWEKALNEAGEYYFICKGFLEAKDLIDKTIKGL